MSSADASGAATPPSDATLEQRTMHVFISKALTKILRECPKKHTQLRTACQEVIGALQPAPLSGTLRLAAQRPYVLALADELQKNGADAFPPPQTEPVPPLSPAPSTSADGKCVPGPHAARGSPEDARGWAYTRGVIFRRAWGVGGEGGREPSTVVPRERAQRRQACCANSRPFRADHDLDRPAPAERMATARAVRVRRTRIWTTTRARRRRGRRRAARSRAARQTSTLCRCASRASPSCRASWRWRCTASRS